MPTLFGETTSEGNLKSKPKSNESECPAMAALEIELLAEWKWHEFYSAV
jgi:hypothetical protein